MIDKFIEFQVAAGIIEESEKEIYKYGYGVIWEMTVNFIIAVAIGFITGNIKNIIIFLALFIPLRSFCGGWHMCSFWKCVIASNIIVVIVVILMDVDIMTFLGLSYFLVDGILVLLIYFLSPLDNENKLLDTYEKERYKKVIFFELCIHVIICIVTWIMEVYYINKIFLLVHIMQYLLLQISSAKKIITVLFDKKKPV